MRCLRRKNLRSLNAILLHPLIPMDQLNFPILSVILGLCSLTALVLGLIPSKGKSVQEVAELCHKISLVSSAIILAVVLGLFYGFFNPDQKGLQFVEAYDWLGKVSSFKLGVDGLSLSMVLLTAILLPFVVLASKTTAEKSKPKLYYSLLFVLVTAVLGVFMAQDLIFFFVFWELELLPMYLLIAIWGGQNRIKAANKFIIYTFLGGGFILAGIILLFWLSGGKTFSLIEAAYQFRTLQASGSLAGSAALVNAVFALFAIGFCIKLPSIPLHTWLPEAHVEAPTPISMLLAGILLKMGAYGLIRFGTQFFPNSLVAFAPILATLGAINIVGAAIFCLVQDDMKRVIAYSSISHMGFVLLGLAALNSQGIDGAIFQMFSHGIISAGLFMVIGVIYERAHTRKISEFSGLAKRMPIFFFLFLGLAMANLGLPALSGFVGESLVFYGAFNSLESLSQVQWSATISTLGVVITAAYMLWLGKRLFFGDELSKWSDFSDVKKTETFVLGSLLALSILFGSFPRLINDKLEPNVNQLAQLIQPQSALEVEDTKN
jgi:NADH-quinone oxidoreductase subunit M